MTGPAFAFDAAAAAFDRHRALPRGVAAVVREAILAALAPSPRPRLLDLGAGTGRFGQAFLAAGDDYVGVDLSFGMLEEFARCSSSGRRRRLVQADGARLPFADAAFDAAMLMHVVSGARRVLALLDEAQRVLRPAGVLILGRTIASPHGVDGRMKERLSALLSDMDASRDASSGREEAEAVLATAASHAERVVAATWPVERSPRGFLERHRTGARFSALPEPVKDEALEKLSEWATKTFGSLDRIFAEEHSFELQIYRFNERAGG
jgi:SAM-dependent methyltransferase